MFNPSRDQVRQFFIDCWRKHQSAAPLTPLESIAVDWIVQHPEYQAELGDSTNEREYSVAEGTVNPFLHLSMHLAISEQLSIDQPSGIRAAVHALTQQKQSLHDAHHVVMECLGEMLWNAQRTGEAPDGQGYVECVQRHVKTRH